ncbi:hypothetical protein ACT2FY_15885 [Paraburkholderia fungorum]|jgi:hypothetical protein|uniref:hypothetical protein n=1 Tax=Paraburkholderia fungorum TaxID=134537 RepID=UPI00402BBDD6
MPSIPGFWEGGPHDPIDVEALWREFVRSAEGQVVEDILPNPRTFENADFLFPALSAVFELKEIQTEFDRSAAFREGYRLLLERVMEEDPHWKPSLLGGSGVYPAWFTSELLRLFRPPISRVLKKANRQIKETKVHFKLDQPTGVLVFVNDGFTALEPHFVRKVAADLLANSYSSIDCFLYTTVNRYVEVEGSDVPRLLWVPTYSDRAPDSLVTFIDELGRKWFEYLEAKIGPFTLAREEISQDQEGARPFTSRAIVLPDERR